MQTAQMHIRITHARFGRRAARCNASALSVARMKRLVLPVREALVAELSKVRQRPAQCARTDVRVPTAQRGGGRRSQAVDGSVQSSYSRLYVTFCSVCPDCELSGLRTRCFIIVFRDGERVRRGVGQRGGYLAAASQSGKFDRSAWLGVRE